jgi:hypothetical protein
VYEGEEAGHEYSSARGQYHIHFYLDDFDQYLNLDLDYSDPAGAEPKHEYAATTATAADGEYKHNHAHIDPDDDSYAECKSAQ